MKICLFIYGPKRRRPRRRETVIAPYFLQKNESKLLVWAHSPGKLRPHRKFWCLTTMFPALTKLTIGYNYENIWKLSNRKSSVKKQSWNWKFHNFKSNFLKLLVLSAAYCIFIKIVDFRDWEFWKYHIGLLL